MATLNDSKIYLGSDLLIENGGGDIPVVEDIGAMYQCVSTDGTTFGTYSEMTSNTVAELAVLRPFNPSNGLLNYWDSIGILTSTLKFTYETGVDSTWHGSLFYISYSDENSNWYSVSAKVRDNRLLLTTQSYSGNTYKQLTAGHTYTVKLNLDASTNRALLYCKEEGVDNDFILIDAHTATFPSSLNAAIMMINNTLSDSNYVSYKFADFDLTDITIDIDGEVIFSRAKSGSGGGGSTPSSDAIGIPREISDQGTLIIPTNITAFELPEEITELGNGALNYAFAYDTNLLTADLSNIQTVGYHGLYYTFQGCTNLTSIDLSGLTTINGTAGCHEMCGGCTSLTSVDLSNLATASVEHALSWFFAGCTSLTTMTFPKLQDINGNQALGTIFNGCTALTDVYFPALKASSFDTYTNQFAGALTGCSNVKVHFPSNLLGKFNTSSFGGNNSRITFDLPATT